MRPHAQQLMYDAVKPVGAPVHFSCRTVTCHNCNSNKRSHWACSGLCCRYRGRPTCSGPPVSPFKPCCACFHPVAVTLCTLSAALQDVAVEVRKCRGGQAVHERHSWPHAFCERYKAHHSRLICRWHFMPTRPPCTAIFIWRTCQHDSRRAQGFEWEVWALLCAQVVTYPVPHVFMDDRACCSLVQSRCFKLSLAALVLSLKKLANPIERDLKSAEKHCVEDGRRDKSRTPATYHLPWAVEE